MEVKNKAKLCFVVLNMVIANDQSLCLILRLENGTYAVRFCFLFLVVIIFTQLFMHALKK